MKKVLYSILSVVLVFTAVSTVLSLLGVSIEGVPFLAALFKLFSIGGVGGATLAVVGPGAPEVTEEATSTPEGTTVVSKSNDGTADPGIGVETPEYLEEDLNKQIVKIRPQDTPFDTFTRTIGNTAPSESWEAGGWEIGTREIEDTVTASTSTTITVDNGDMWKEGDSFIIHSADANGNDIGPLMNNQLPVSGLIQSVSGNVLTVRGINVVDRAGVVGQSAALPNIAAGSILRRLSPAVSELTASVDGFALQPTPGKYYNQIHMCQVEESVIHDLQKKKVAMDFAVYKEQTIWDMKRGMEYSNLFQVGGLSKNAKNEPVHLAMGAWWQMDHEYNIDFTSNASPLTNNDWNAFGKYIFEGNNGAERRLFFVGPDLMLRIADVPSYQKQLEANKTEIVLGLRVNRIETPFGELLIKNMGNLFPGYYSKCGMVVDPNYVKKYIMEPLQTTNLDLDKTGQRRVKNAVRIHETYSLFLENLPTHTRVVPIL